MECIGVASGCGEQEVGVASGSGWNIDFIILLIPTPLISVLFCSSIPTFLLIFLMFFVLRVYGLYVIDSMISTL